MNVFAMSALSSSISYNLLFFQIQHVSLSLFIYSKVLRVLLALSSGYYSERPHSEHDIECDHYIVIPHQIEF